jgi:UDP-arabinose 4-epimerase
MARLRVSEGWMKTVFVTGGAGYVGSHSCKAFHKAGWNVVTYDNLSRGRRDAVKWGALVEGDIGDENAVAAALAAARPDLVVHFAAYTYVGESIERPDMYYRNNTAATLVLLEAMRRESIKNIVFSSTCATYGIPTSLPVDETHPQLPINPYGWSKMIIERMLEDYGNAYGFNTVALRYFNAAGGDPEGEIGERPGPEPRAIPRAVATALSDEEIFTVNGTEFDTRDGSAVRDYVHVTDLARAHVLAAEMIGQRGGTHVFNLGTGVGTSVFEVLEAVRRASGRQLQVRVGPARRGDPPVLVAAAGKAKQELGWVPELSIDRIVETAVAWQRSLR